MFDRDFLYSSIILARIGSSPGGFTDSCLRHGKGLVKLFFKGSCKKFKIYILINLKIKNK